MKKTFYFNPNEKGDNAVEVSVFYQKGGMNWYNGKQESGGFYVSFHSGVSDKNDKYSSFTCMLFDGFKIRVADGTRDNKKKCQTILDSITEEIAQAAFDNKPQTVFDLLSK